MKTTGYGKGPNWRETNYSQFWSNFDEIKFSTTKKVNLPKNKKSKIKNAKNKSC